jgi:hypothetical protein
MSFCARSLGARPSETPQRATRGMIDAQLHTSFVVSKATTTKLLPKKKVPLPLFVVGV